MSAHRAVLLEESLAALALKPAGVYVDATFGRGGHSRAILERLGPSGRLIALDRDPQAIAAAREIVDPRFAAEHATGGRRTGGRRSGDGRCWRGRHRCWRGRGWRGARRSRRWQTCRPAARGAGARSDHGPGSSRWRAAEGGGLATQGRTRGPA